LIRNGIDAPAEGVKILVRAPAAFQYEMVFVDEATPVPSAQ
jgi:hypothetical protein